MLAPVKPEHWRPLGQWSPVFLVYNYSISVVVESEMYPAVFHADRRLTDPASPSQWAGPTPGHAPGTHGLITGSPGPRRAAHILSVSLEILGRSVGTSGNGGADWHIDALSGRLTCRPEVRREVITEH